MTLTFIFEKCNQKFTHDFKKKILFLFLFCCQNAFCQDFNLKNSIQNFNSDRPYSDQILNLEKKIKESNNDSLILEGLYLLGSSYFSLEKYDLSYNKYSQALRHAKKLNSNYQKGRIYEALGSIQFKLENFDKSQDLYTQSLSNFILTKNENRIAIAKGNLALVDIKKGYINKATITLNQLSNNSSIDNQSKAIINLSLGNVYLEKHSLPRKAIHYYNKALLSLPKENNNIKSSIYQNIAECYLALQQYDEALKFNNLSKDYITNNNHELNSSLHLFYATIYEKTNKFQLALQHYKKHEEFKDKLNQSKNLLIIENQEILNQLKNTLNEDKIKEQKIKILKKDKQLANVRLYLILVTILIIMVILYMLIKKQRNKISKLYQNIYTSQDKLKFTQDNTEKIILNTQQNQNFIKHVTLQLNKLQKEIKDVSVKKQLNTLIFDLQNIKNINSKNDSFYNNIQSSFLYNLEKKCYGLTEEEKRISELIFLNYKNKEIASMLNLSIRSVENHRYRIRKKLNIDTNVNLFDYFKKNINN